MAFFSNLREKVGSMTRKSNKVMEIKKLKKNIRTEEDGLKVLYRKLGEYCFEKYITGEINDSIVAELGEDIKIHLENINFFQEKIKEIKNTVLCSSCGSKTLKTNKFCDKCGAKLGAKDERKEDTEEQTVSDDGEDSGSE